MCTMCVRLYMHMRKYVYVLLLEHGGLSEGVGDGCDEGSYCTRLFSRRGTRERGRSERARAAWARPRRACPCGGGRRRAGRACGQCGAGAGGSLCRRESHSSLSLDTRNRTHVVRLKTNHALTSYCKQNNVVSPAAPGAGRRRPHRARQVDLFIKGSGCLVRPVLRRKSISFGSCGHPIGCSTLPPAVAQPCHQHTCP